MRVRRWIRNDGGNDRRAFRGLNSGEAASARGGGELACAPICAWGGRVVKARLQDRDGC